MAPVSSKAVSFLESMEQLCSARGLGFIHKKPGTPGPVLSLIIIPPDHSPVRTHRLLTPLIIGMHGRSLLASIRISSNIKPQVLLGMVSHSRHKRLFPTLDTIPSRSPPPVMWFARASLSYPILR